MSRSVAEYLPGRCNIGEKEVRQRVILGWSAAVATLIAGGLLIAMHVAPWWRLVLAVPAFFSALGFIQAAWHFCAAYGLLGVFNVGSDLQHRDTVEQARMRKEDRATALSIIGLSLLVGLAVGGIAFVIPV